MKTLSRQTIAPDCNGTLRLSGKKVLGVSEYVGGVAKTGTYAVAAAPVVAGGAGVARFYVDTNGDGTGTAPSEIEIATLQTVVTNTTLGYVPQSFTVDTSRKYIDVKMGALSFSGLTILGQTVLGAQSIANAANGITVNCFVIVKQ